MARLRDRTCDANDTAGPAGPPPRHLQNEGLPTRGRWGKAQGARTGGLPEERRMDDSDLLEPLADIDHLPISRQTAEELELLRARVSEVSDAAAPDSAERLWAQAVLEDLVTEEIEDGRPE